MINKTRLDIYLTENGYADSRSIAQAVIMAGEVYINDQKADKAGTQVTGNEIIEVRSKSQKYVSRGGKKLEKAIDVFAIDLNGKVCIDIGASTGGFTDCMLQKGAAKIFAVDVGYGQLAWKLRSDKRVVNMERTNIRYVTADEIGEKIDFASVDVSFISLKLVLPVVVDLLSENGECVCLIKPQFEAGKENIGKNGVVRDKKIHKSVINDVICFTNSFGFDILGLDFSPIRGPEGNIEYLMWIGKNVNGEDVGEIGVEKTVDASHEME